MDVTYSDNVTNTIKCLRNEVYNKDEFKNTFTDNLKKSINATDTNFIPDQFGGWSVSINTSDKHYNSSDCVSKVTSALLNSIKCVNSSIPCSSAASNLANVIITGLDSLVVKL